MPIRRSRRVPPEGMKWCPRCGEFKELKTFSGGYCRACFYEYRKAWEQKHQGRTLTIKLEALQHYGLNCWKCGITDPKVLVIYPPGRDGERALLYELKEDGWPLGYTTTCRNCLVYLKER